MKSARNMKGFVFTLDAVFALIVAAVGVSIILYINSATISQYNGATSQAYSILQSALHTTISSAAFGQYVGYLNDSAQYSNSSWRQIGRDELLDSGSNYSISPFLLYTYNTVNAIMPFVPVDSESVALVSANEIYFLNATTGAAINSISANVITAPAIYMGNVYYAESETINGVDLYNVSSGWTFTASNYVTTPIGVENNYVVVGTSNGLYLLNPSNGNEIGFASTGAPVEGVLYVDGNYIASISSATSSIYSYSLSGNSLSSTWNAQLTGSSITMPCSTNDTVAVGSDDQLYIFTLGGTLVNQSVHLSSRITGISAYQGDYYVETGKDIYRFTSSGEMLFAANTVSNTQNSIPSVSPDAVYTLANGNDIEAYDHSGKPLFNITLPSTYDYNGYSNIALAYGNMYVASGNTLYVFGTYKPKQGDSILQAVSSMYLNNHGSYADVMMESLYNSTKSGIFIYTRLVNGTYVPDALNSTYAPDLSVATFNSSYIMHTNGFAWMDNAASRFSISIWVNPTSSNGVIVDELGQQSLSGSWHKSMVELVNGKLYARIYNLGCMSLGSIPTDTWSNIVITYNGVVENGYVNGKLMNSTTGTRSVPGDGALMYYSLGSGDSVNCGSGAYYSGKMLNYQVYNSVLDKQQVGMLYQKGAFGSPVNSSGDAMWMPLVGGTNDFSGGFNFGITHGNVTYTNTTYMPVSFYNAYQVSSAPTSMIINVNGTYRNYYVSVVEWR